MNTYVLYIKSHSEAPDYEEEVEAKNKHEATIYFLKKLEKYGWSKSDIRKMIIKI
ncbi:MAG: hypothetical protein WC055_15855 [Melioribacteraceae bacterium]